MPADEKAAALLVRGRITIRRVDEDGRMLADVLGDHGKHTVRRTPNGHWSCDCPAHYYRQKCAHIRSVRLVAADKPEWE